MVGYRPRVIVIDGATLILRIKIFCYEVPQPPTIFEVQLRAQHPVLEIIKQIAPTLLITPAAATAIAVIV